MRYLPLLLLLFMTATRAQDAMDPEKRAAIKELMATTGAQASQQELTATFTQQLVSVIQANGVEVTPATREIIRGEVDAFISEQLEDEILQQKMYRIYARYFTLEELQGLIEFNRSPVGAKANRVMPLLIRESMNAAQSWSEEIGPTLSSRVRDRLAQEGIHLERPGSER